MQRTSLRQSGGHAAGRNFDIELRTDADGRSRLILRGELDAAGRGELREALLAGQRSGSAVVVVLDQLDYLDSAGIGELVEAARRARTRGWRFAVTPATGNVRRVLWISGVLGQLCGEAAQPAERTASGGAISRPDTETSA